MLRSRPLHPALTSATWGALLRRYALRGTALALPALSAATAMAAEPVPATPVKTAPTATEAPAYVAPRAPDAVVRTIPEQFDVGVFGGGTLISSVTRLGLAHSPLDVPGNAGEVGARVAWVTRKRHLGVEFETRDAFYQLVSKYAHGQLWGFRGQLTWNFLPEARIQPFVLAGLGGELIINSKPTCPSNTPPTNACLPFKTPHSIPAGIFGAGVRVPLTYRLAFRADIHYLLEQGRAADPTTVPATPSVATSSNFEITGGLSWTFGGALEDSDKDGNPDETDKCPNEAEDKDGFEDADGCPDPDNDGDGLADNLDRCPNQAEDKDNWKDDDGCPDPDNDDDGIPDNLDRCPNQPETRNGFKDDDGCPDVADSDGDGIPEDKDKCPKQKEDKDGFEDEDGCPDPDNDKDGIPDNLDKCPNQPETVNALFDTDGCPDSLPPAAQRLLDAPTSLTFQGIKLVGGDEAFDPLLELLLEHEGVKLTIEVAMDNETPEATKLARERAQAVLAALEAKGIDAVRMKSVAGKVVPVAAEPEPATKSKKAKKAKKKAVKGEPTVARPVFLSIQ